jgi:hypothetical protein
MKGAAETIDPILHDLSDNTIGLIDKGYIGFALHDSF